MERITFPDGEWIEVRDAAEVPERLRRPYLSAGMAVSRTDDQTGAVRRAQALGAVAVLSGWSYPAAVSVEALEDLPSLRYDEILSACESRVDKLTWSMIPTPEAIADPKATTDEQPSSGPGWPIPTQ